MNAEREEKLFVKKEEIKFMIYDDEKWDIVRRFWICVSFQFSGVQLSYNDIDGSGKTKVAG